MPSSLYILSAVWLAPRNVSFPPSRPCSPGPTAKAKAPPPRVLRLPLPHLPHPHLVIRTSRDPSQSRTSQPTSRTPYPCRGPLILENMPFPLLTPAVLRLRLDLSRTLLLPPFAKVYVPPSDDNLVQPAHGVCCMITIITCLFPLHVILRTFQTPLIIIEFLYITAFCCALNMSARLRQMNSLSTRTLHLRRWSLESPSAPVPTSKKPRFPSTALQRHA